MHAVDLLVHVKNCPLKYPVVPSCNLPARKIALRLPEHDIRRRHGQVATTKDYFLTETREAEILRLQSGLLRSLPRNGNDDDEDEADQRVTYSVLLTRNFCKQ